MAKKTNGNGKQSPTDEVQLGIYVKRDLRSKGQIAIKILGYPSMTKFLEEKLEEAIEQADKRYAIK